MGHRGGGIAMTRDIIGKRKIFFTASLLFIMLGLVAFFRNEGLNYDIQFQGGTVMQFEMQNANFEEAKAVSLIQDKVDGIVTARKSESTEGGVLNGGKRVAFLILNISQKQALSIEKQTEIINIINKNFPVDKGAQVSVNTVDASIGSELKAKAGWAVIISSILIIFYVWWRFSAMSGLFAGLTAIIALIHDVAIMFSVYTLFDIPVNESFIAAILTIIGYSMNDTVVIYDRVRENSTLLKKASVTELVNKSIHQSLARTINTSVMVLLCIVTVYILARVNNVESIRQFAFPLIIGVLSGTYSSIFIASPLYVMWKEREKRRMALSRAKA